MIKVNLLRDKTTVAEAEKSSGPVVKKSYVGILSNKGGGGYAEPEVGPMVKLLIMLIPVASFYLYEMKLQSDAAKKVSRITDEVAQTTTIRDQKKQIVDTLNVFKAEYEVRVPILNEFKLISKEKLHGIKILDQLQDLIPPKIWLTEIDLDRTRIDISGISASDKELTVFQRNFEDSVFENILIYNSIESKTERGDTIISFRMKANFKNGVISGS